MMEAANTVEIKKKAVSFSPDVDKAAAPLTERERQQIQMLERLVAACDHYVACYMQESMLRTDEETELEKVREVTERQKEELERTQTEAEEQRKKLEHELEEERQKEIEWDILKEKEQSLVGYVQELMLLGDQMAELLDQKNKKCARMQVEINYLKAQNQRYQRLFQRVSETWYGRLLKKVYHFMQRHGWI